MKLYYLPGACPLASNIALEWAGQPYELQLISREELKQPAYLALNPLGAVPTLVDGDFVLTQSAAILEFIAELNPSAKLLRSEEHTSGLQSLMRISYDVFCLKTTKMI